MALAAQSSSARELLGLPSLRLASRGKYLPRLETYAAFQVAFGKIALQPRRDFQIGRLTAPGLHMLARPVTNNRLSNLRDCRQNRFAERMRPPNQCHIRLCDICHRGEHPLFDLKRHYPGGSGQPFRDRRHNGKHRLSLIHI